MVKVITYGTYDLLHYGHIRLLERAKALGDYLIVGVTADDFDKIRGKINVQQSLIERIEAVRSTGIADEIIVEEYEGQKIDDIRKYDVDIFTVGSDWIGYFDYLKEYCKVVYLDRTEGISSSELRKQKRLLLLGLVGDSDFLNKIEAECRFVNGIRVKGICTNSIDTMSESIKNLPIVTNKYEYLLENIDAIYIKSQPIDHYWQIKKALCKGIHVLCEAPMTIDKQQSEELFDLAKAKGLILMEAIKTAYSTAYARLLLLIKGGKIGEVVSVDSTCTSLRSENINNSIIYRKNWDGIYEWGPTALLPIFQILGCKFRTYDIVARFSDEDKEHDEFVKMSFLYNNAVASIKIGNGVKSEGELIISGTKGYIYVPAPWWKTDYFEIRYENPANNKRYFYQLDGEGIRYELVAFAKAVEHRKITFNINNETTMAISEIMGLFKERVNVKLI